jgi:hypothetical protein
MDQLRADFQVGWPESEALEPPVGHGQPGRRQIGLPALEPVEQLGHVGGHLDAQLDTEVIGELAGQVVFEAGRAFRTGRSFRTPMGPSGVGRNPCDSVKASSTVPRFDASIPLSLPMEPATRL